MIKSKFESKFRALGYKNISGKVEEEVHYFKRMSGVLHLYFTLLISMEKSHVQSKLGLKAAWQWFSDVLNLSPRPNITAEMITIFLKCCGYHMQLVYGKQFIKMVHVFEREFFELIKSLPKEKQSGASIGRLQTVLDQFKKNNRFPEWANVN